MVDLLQRGVGTVRELAARLRLTNNAVRSHLLALEREGLVHRIGSQPGTRRPHEVYQLTARAHKHLAQASSATLCALVTALKRHLPKQDLPRLLEAAGKALAFRFGTYNLEKPLTSRVKNGARVLNSIGGAANVEKRGDGFAIRSHGCPLAPLVAEHPETCYMVEKFLAGIIRAPVRESCLRGQYPQCRFTVGPKESELSANQTAPERDGRRLR